MDEYSAERTPTFLICNLSAPGKSLLKVAMNRYITVMQTENLTAQSTIFSKEMYTAPIPDPVMMSWMYMYDADTAPSTAPQTLALLLIVFLSIASMLSVRGFYETGRYLPANIVSFSKIIDTFARFNHLYD